MPNIIVCGRLLTYSKIYPIYEMMESDSVISAQPPSLHIPQCYVLMCWSPCHVVGHRTVTTRNQSHLRTLCERAEKEKIQSHVVQDAKNLDARMCSRGNKIKSFTPSN